MNPKSNKKAVNNKENTSSAVSINWFPGHMAKTRRLIKESLPLVDAVAEIRDARVVISSKNPEIEKILGNKKRIVILNKVDSADTATTQKWCDYFEKQGVKVVCTDSKNGKGINKFYPAVCSALSQVLENRNAKGMASKAIRVMIVGIPNVGKSSFINRMAKSKKTKVEDRPGVTRGMQWVEVDKTLELLDMPGMLWPKFESQQVAEHLAFTGAIKDDIMDIEELSVKLLNLLKENYPQMLCERYGIEILPEDDGYELLCKIARKRGMLVSKGEVNTERAAITVIDEFRAGKIGRISLESPSDL